MCTHQKYVLNKYTGQKIKVKCGKCDACKQEKANRLTSRINNHASNTDKYCFFVTLTYDEKFIPYIKRIDLENEQLFELPLYRDYKVRSFRGRTIVHDCSSNPVMLGSIPLYDKESGDLNREFLSFHGNLWKKGRGFHPDKLGLIYYKDFQDFTKRLRINLERRYGKGLFNLDFFATSEYGENHYRPHFHVLVFAERQIFGKDTYSRLHAAICDSWLFASRDELANSIELALDAAAYVSSYVNSPADLPQVFPRLSKAKHSCSRFLGVGLSHFSLPALLEKADNGTLTYPKRTVVDGVSTVLNVPIPKYVISRYFPLFKGLNRCSLFEVECALRESYNFFRYHKSTSITNYYKRDGSIDDTWTNYVRIRNAKKRYIEITGKNDYDFAIDYMRVWNCFKTTLYKLQFEQDIPQHELYDNINELYDGYVRNDTLSHVIGNNADKFPRDSNCFKSVKQQTDHYAQLYQRRVKHSKENNFIRQRFLGKNI